VPTSGSLEIWFKAPAAGATVSGVKQLEGCYVHGRGVSRVEFFLDSTRLNTDTVMSDGMSCALDSTKFSNGSHQLKAVAYDSSGRSYTETTSINIQNTTSGGSTDGGTTTPPPSGSGVTFSSPANGATLSGSSNTCAVSVPSGTTYVRFYRDGVWLNTDTSAPWTCNVSTSGLSTGAHKLKAIALASGAVKGESEITFYVGTSGSGTTNAAPSVSISSPASSAVLSNSASCAASASDGDGSISKVEFLLGSTVVATDTASPYACSFDTTKFANGSYTFTARATDNLGKATSVSRSVSIQNQVVTDPGTGTGGAISSTDIMGTAQAEVPFSQQKGFNTQILNQYLDSASIPESGMHAFTLSNGETLRFGKYADPRNSSRKAFAFQVDPKDVTTSGAKRAELKFGNNIEIGKVYWAAMSVYVYDWGTLKDTDDSLWGLQQHNGSPADLSPNFAIYTSGTGRTFQIHARGSSSSSPSYGNTTTVKYPDVPIPFGRWADFVFKFKLSPSGGGFLQVWLDGTQIVNHQGILGYVTPGYKVSAPSFASGSGVGMSGMYQLAPGTPGYGTGARIPNFNDQSATPDIGAHQSGAPAMTFGVTGHR
jgi:hypothetical protein